MLLLQFLHPVLGIPVIIPNEAVLIEHCLPFDGLIVGISRLLQK